MTPLASMRRIASCTAGCEGRPLLIAVEVEPGERPNCLAISRTAPWGSSWAIVLFAFIVLHLLLIFIYKTNLTADTVLKQQNLLSAQQKQLSVMEESVNQRLNLLVDKFERGIKSAFAQRIGISQQGAHDLLGGRKGAPSFKVLSAILEKYPQVRAEWLILADGPMLHSDAQEFSTTKQTNSSQLMVEAASITRELDELNRLLASMELSGLTLQGEIKTAEHLLDLGTQIPELQEQYIHRVEIARKLLQVNRGQIELVRVAIAKQHALLGNVHSQIANALKAQATQAEASKQESN